MTTLYKSVSSAFTHGLFLCLLAAVQSLSYADEQQKKPNVIFLFADDQRADTIAALGNPHIKTPNLDSLVRRGFSFRSNYIFGGNSGAVCVPSRAMLIWPGCAGVAQPSVMAGLDASA